MEKFEHTRVSSRIIRIVDLSHTALYLVIGDERACLIDTGCGIQGLRSYVDSLTCLDYDVILTHGHVDHAGGAEEFSDKKIYLHPADRDLMKAHVQDDIRIDYLRFAGKIDIAADQLSPSLDPSLTLPLNDEDRFDLGGLHLKAIHVPGHTHGMCMILIEEERTILFGDGCGVSVMILDEYSTTVSEYLEALKKVKQIEDSYDLVIRNHGTFVSEKDILDNVMACCQSILNETDDHVPAEGLPVSCDDAFFAKKMVKDKNGHVMREDGKQGNIAYRMSKIR